MIIVTIIFLNNTFLQYKKKEHKPLGLDISISVYWIKMFLEKI